MDKYLKDVSCKAIDNIKSAIRHGNNSDAARFSADIIVISVTKDAKLGILTGEILESVIIQYGHLIRRYALNDKQIKNEENALLKLLTEVSSAISGGVKTEIQDSLSEIRAHVTREQLEGFPIKYAMRSKIERRGSI